MSSPAGYESRNSDLLDFNAIVRRLWGGRWWIVGASVGFAVLAAIAALRMTPIYRATVVLIPAIADRAGSGYQVGSSLGSLGGLAAIAGINLGGANSELQEAIAVLRSRQFADSFIREKKLLPVFFPKQWDAQSESWKGPEVKRPTAAAAFRYFDANVRAVVEDKKSGLVALQINWRDRKAAAEWANELVARLNGEMQRRAIAEAEASLGFLKKELEETTIIGTREAINRLIENQVNRRMLANVSAEYAFRVVDPAVPPDEGDVVRPQKIVMVLIGAFLGFLVGVTVIVMLRR